MSEYLSPGVYVKEVPSAIRPIAGVSTSTAGFIGVVDDKVIMPPEPGKFEDGKPISYAVAASGEPQLITNWEEFKNTFGDIQDSNKVLAHAVYGFFNNGGTRCWVIRVTDLKKTKKDTQEVDQVKDALAKFEAIDEIALVAVPMPTDLKTAKPKQNEPDPNLARHVEIREMVLSHCENMEDRFAILDGEETVEDNIEPKTIYSKADRSAMGKTSKYGAVYFPWIDVSGEKDYIPPCGHIAGIYARVDSERGVHKAPANEVIRGALGLKYRVSRSQQDGLNPDGINVIRQFNGTVTVWGARTIGGDANADFKYVNARRLFNFLRESIEEGTRWAVFEPNNKSLWQKIKRNLTAFLTNVWRDGALFGDTPEQAFYVKCDEETNPPDVRELGQVVTEIGVAIVKPAEFVIFKISQWGGPSA